MTISKLYLFKRPNGFWYILYTLEGKTKWKSTKTTSKHEALQRLQEFRPRQEVQPKTKPLTEFTKEFLSFAETTYAHSTCNIYRVCLRHLLRIAGDCPLRAIDQRHVDFYKADRLKKKSPVTVNTELRSLRTILNFAVRWKLIETNPFTKVQLVRIPEMPPLYFTREEFDSLLLVIDQEWFKEAVIFTVLTGMRRGEVANLHWSDVDLERRLVHVHSTPTFKSKWGKQRVIPLNDQIVQMLGKRLNEDGANYVFTFGGRKVVESYLSHKFTDYVRAAKIPKKLHFHSLRHTHATWLVQDGVPIYEVQKLLGHSSIEMTQVYSHLQSEQLHTTVNRLKLDLIQSPVVRDKIEQKGTKNG